MTSWQTRAWIERKTVHVGDRDIDGWPHPVGRTWRTWFVYDTPSSDDLFLVAGVFGTDSDRSEIRINDTRIGRLPRRAKGEFRVTAHRIPAGLLRVDENTLEIRAARLGERVDNFLVRNVRISRRVDPPSPLPPPGGDKNEFFRLLARGMRNLKWKGLSVPGFEWASVAAHDWEPALFAAFDADRFPELVDYAYAKFNAWADRQNDLPSSRVAIAVFDRADPGEIRRITTELQEGTRMKRPMRMTAVLDLSTKRFHAPREVGWAGLARIVFNSRYGSELEKVLRVIAP